MEHRLPHKHRGLVEKDSIFKSPPRKFVSITRYLIQLSREGLLKCPSCNCSLDMEKGIEWYGPEDFECQNCSRMVRLERLQYIEDYIDKR